MSKNYFIVFNRNLDSRNRETHSLNELDYRWLCADSTRELAEKLDHMSVKFAIFEANMIKDFDSEIDLSKL